MLVRSETLWHLRGLRMENGAIQQKFTEALDALVEQVKRDRFILTAILPQAVLGPYGFRLHYQKVSISTKLPVSALVIECALLQINWRL